MLVLRTKYASYANNIFLIQIQLQKYSEKAFIVLKEYSKINIYLSSPSKENCDFEFERCLYCECLNLFNDSISEF